MTRYFLLLALAGCGNRLHHGVDAPPLDTPTDTVGTSTGDPTPNAVSLVVTRAGMPVAGVAVMFQNADSSLVHAVLTDAKGLAWAEMASGGYVTAIERVSSGVEELTTFAAVEQRDALRLDFLKTGGSGESMPYLEVTADAGAGAYKVYSSCGGPFGFIPAAPEQVLLVGCNGVADFAVVSFDGDGNLLNGYYAPSVAIPNASEPPYPTLTVAGTYQGLFPSPIAYTNVPAPFSFLGTYHAFANARGRTYETSTGAEVSGGNANATLVMPLATEKVLTVTTTYGGVTGDQLIYESRDNAAQFSLDVGAALLPTYATTPAYDPATRTISWTENAGGVAADLVRVGLQVARGGSPVRTWKWRMVAPRSATSVTYPQLPSFGFDFNPASTDTATVNELSVVDVPGGYAAVRARGFANWVDHIAGTDARMTVQILKAPEL